MLAFGSGLSHDAQTRLTPIPSGRTFVDGVRPFFGLGGGFIWRRMPPRDIGPENFVVISIGGMSGCEPDAR